MSEIISKCCARDNCYGCHRQMDERPRTMSKPTVDTAPHGIDQDDWNTTRSIRNQMAELLRLQDEHNLEKHKIQKYCNCPEMNNLIEAYSYLRQQFMRCFYRPQNVDEILEAKEKMRQLYEMDLIDPDQAKGNICTQEG